MISISKERFRPKIWCQPFWLISKPWTFKRLYSWSWSHIYVVKHSHITWRVRHWFGFQIHFEGLQANWFWDSKNPRKMTSRLPLTQLLVLGGSPKPSRLTLMVSLSMGETVCTIWWMRVYHWATPIMNPNWYTSCSNHIAQLGEALKFSSKRHSWLGTPLHSSWRTRIQVLRYVSWSVPIRLLGTCRDETYNEVHNRSWPFIKLFPKMHLQAWSIDIPSAMSHHKIVFPGETRVPQPPDSNVNNIELQAFGFREMVAIQNHPLRMFNQGNPFFCLFGMTVFLRCCFELNLSWVVEFGGPKQAELWTTGTQTGHVWLWTQPKSMTNSTFWMIVQPATQFQLHISLHLALSSKKLIFNQSKTWVSGAERTVSFREFKLETSEMKQGRKHANYHGHTLIEKQWQFVTLILHNSGFPASIKPLGMLNNFCWQLWNRMPWRWKILQLNLSLGNPFAAYLVKASDVLNHQFKTLAALPCWSSPVSWMKPLDYDPEN